MKVFDEIPYIVGKKTVLKKITEKDAPSLAEMTKEKEVYKYLPTFLYEQKYDDAAFAIKQFYGECFDNKESLILGVYLKETDEFCGIAEMYGFKDDIHKISLGCRLRQKYWGMGLAVEVTELLTDHLYGSSDIEIITASSMVENRGSARVLEKCGFTLVVSDAEEDWGFDKPVKVHKWIR